MGSPAAPRPRPLDPASESRRSPVRFAHRLNDIPTYIFAELETKLQTKPSALVDLSRSDPDLPPPDVVREALAHEAMRPDAHRYPSYPGELELRRLFVHYLEARFGIPLLPDEVQVVAGTKEALVHAFLAFLDPGDVALLPDPAFPAYRVGTRLAGAEVVPLPLRAERGFLPDLSTIAPQALARAKLLVLNYPHNPSGALAPDAFLDEVAAFARRHDLILFSDQAYAEVAPQPQPSLFRKAPERTLEFYTFSKPFSMQGYRLGVVIGQPFLLAAFRKVEDNISAGVFRPVQAAGAAALRLALQDDDFFRRRHNVYQRRLHSLGDAFRHLGLEVTIPRATVYLWLPAPEGMDGDSFAEWLLKEAGILVTPGRGFGREGRRSVRVSVTAPDDAIARAVSRLEDLAARHVPVRPAGPPPTP